MKQFTVEEYNRRKAAGLNHEVVTRNGLKAEILKTDLRNDLYPIVVVLTSEGGREATYTYTQNGEYCDGMALKNDLFFKQDDPKVNELENISIRGEIKVPELSVKPNYDELRAHYSGLAMVELIRKDSGKLTFDDIAKFAVRYADTLIKELNKK